MMSHFTTAPLLFTMPRIVACHLLAVAIGLALNACSAVPEPLPPIVRPAPDTGGVALPPTPAPAPLLLRHSLAGLPADSLIAERSDRGIPESAWVDSVLATMTLRARIGQLIIPWTLSSVSGAKKDALKRMVRDLGLGGVIISTGNVDDAARLTQELQDEVDVPLLISADFENGLGMRLDGATSFPSLMALGATGDPDLAYDMGRAVAAEARAVGVMQNYAPVCDVNNNAGNPIINVRSFGEDPALVARLAAAYARGMQDGGILATAKHFPGHGDTDVDSHIALPVMPGTAARLDSIELLPFRRLVDAGVLSVMTGHIAAPTIDPDSGMPASFSRRATDSLIRDCMGFRGLIVTDALNMSALSAQSRNRPPAAMALSAGADMLLMPADAKDAIDAIERDVHSGRIPEVTVDRAAQRVLTAKDWLGLAHPAALRLPADTMRAAAHLALARRIAERAVTLVRSTGRALPLRHGQQHIGCVQLVSGTGTPRTAALTAELRGHFPDLRTVEVGRSPSAKDIDHIMDTLGDCRHLIVAGFIKVAEWSGVIGLSREQQALVERLRRRGARIILLSFGSPYLLQAVPQAVACINAYGDDDPSIRAAVAALTGELNPTGVLPITIPGLAERGTSLSYPDENKRAMTEANRFAAVDSLVMAQIRQKSFPGAQLWVQQHGRLLHARTYGTMTYDPLSAPIMPTTMYDIASMSKVVVTTTATMMLVDEGRIDLDAPVVRYLPEFGVNGKERITIRHLLLHTSGLPAFLLFYRSCTTARQVIDSIMVTRLDAPPGARMVYSDLGMITLGRVIERITGSPLDVFARERIIEPLGMRNTMYAPPDSLRSLCAPTELDAYWRHRLVQGTVHDETAALLDGVAGHAGVFSTAADLAVFAQMLLDGGRIRDRRLLAASTIAMFTKRQERGSSRALGWDMRSTSGSSAGQYFSMRSFGHTGFTGTSIWIDPDADMFVIFLTNRVHPTRENRKLLGFRAVLHDAIRRAIGG